MKLFNSCIWKQSSTSRALILITLLLTGSGCKSTYNTTTKSELQSLKGKGPIHVLTIDSVLYTFNTFSLTSSHLHGTGLWKKEDSAGTFSGSIPFQQIVFIERLEWSFWKTLWVMPILTLSSTLMFATLDEPSHFDMHRVTGGSCPYVYAYDGTAYKLEAESFGTSISKALEAQTFSVLPSLKSIDHVLKIRIANERPETHFLNQVELFAVDACGAGTAVLDVKNTVWPVYRPVAPSSAYTQSGKNILQDIERKDGVYWKTDYDNIAPFSGFRDQIELQFDLPIQTSDATFIIQGINTDLVTEAYRSAGTILGDATIEFYRALEHDQQLQNTVRQWIKDCGLKIEVAYGSTWKEAGVMLPEASVTPFSRALRISGLSAIQNPLRIRISSLTDVWRLDAVSIECSQVQPLSLHPLKLVSVQSTDGQNWKTAVESKDTAYAVILPPHALDLQFDATPASTMKKPLYVFAAQGFLYEWFPESPQTPERLITSKLPGRDRVSMLKLLIQQQDLFLPPVYSRWRNGQSGGGKN